MIMAHFCQTAGNAAQGENHFQTHRHEHKHLHTPCPSIHIHTHKQKMQEDGQLLIELR